VIDLTGYNYRQILQSMLERIPPTFDKRDTSPIPTALSPAAYALEGFYITLDSVQRAAFIQTAGGQALDYLAVLGNIQRAQASPAVRLGVFNMPVALGSRFSTINGAGSINFTVTAATANPLEYQLTAETPGVAGNDYSGSILPITAINGLSQAQLTDILIPGEDIETDEELRARLIASLNSPAFGGNIAAYREYLMAIEGVGAVQVYPVWQGGGTVKCSILGADFLPASQVLVQTVQNAVDPPPNQGLGLGMAPIGAKVTIGTAAALIIDVSAKVTLAVGYTIGQVQPLAEGALAEYLLEVRRAWGNPSNSAAVDYAASIYQARVLAAILGVTGVVNVTAVKLNNQAADLALIENGDLQQIPLLGTVNLNV